MDLLTNAVESIQVGIEDYGMGTRPRLLSAVRNLHAGILLLFKEALRRRSAPGSAEALLKAKIRPVQGTEGAVLFVGVGKRTADVATIRERFDGLRIAVDWDRFRRISDIRNEIEHYYPALSADSIKELVASAFWLIRDFIAGELNGDPAALLGKETWQTMLAVADVFEAERRVCNSQLDTIEWNSAVLSTGVREIACTACGSGLLKPETPGTDLDDTRLKCTACGEPIDADTFVPEAVAAALSFEMYLVYTDGNDEPYVECPECGLLTYVVQEEGCARCGTTIENTDCARCGNRIPISEMMHSPLCNYCSHLMSKDD